MRPLRDLWKEDAGHLFSWSKAHIHNQKQIFHAMTGSVWPQHELIGGDRSRLLVARLLRETCEEHHTMSQWITDDWLGVRVSRKDEEGRGTYARAVSLVILAQDCVVHRVSLITLRARYLKESTHGEDEYVAAAQRFREKHSRHRDLTGRGELGAICAVGQLHQFAVWDSVLKTWKPRLRLAYLVEEAFCTAAGLLSTLQEAAQNSLPMSKPEAHPFSHRMILCLMVQEHLKMVRSIQNLLFIGHCCYDISAGNWAVEPSHWCDSGGVESLRARGKHPCTPIYSSLEVLKRLLQQKGRLPIEAPRRRVHDERDACAQRDQADAIHSLGMIGLKDFLLKHRAEDVVRVTQEFSALFEGFQAPAEMPEEQALGEEGHPSAVAQDPQQAPPAREGDVSAPNASTLHEQETAHSQEAERRERFSTATASFEEQFIAWWKRVILSARDLQTLFPESESMWRSYVDLLERMTDPRVPSPHILYVTSALEYILDGFSHVQAAPACDGSA